MMHQTDQAVRESIPTISLQHFLDKCSCDSELFGTISREVLSACTKYGFFYLTDVDAFQGANALRVDQAWKAAESLFLDDGKEVREQRLATRNRANNTGYTAIEEEKLDIQGSRANRGDLKESFYIARLSVDSLQPIPPALNSYRESLSDLFEACKRVCAILLGALGHGLGLGGDFFSARHDAHHDRLRLIHYPAAPITSVADESVVRAGSHSDYGSVTLLFQRDVSGLQVLIDDVWTDVPPKDGAIVVNVGDALEFWTAGLCRSAQHRVVMPRTQAETMSRFSIAYFCQPDEEARLEPLRSIASASSDVRKDYDEVLRRKGIKADTQSLTGGEHLRARLEASYA